MNRKITRLLAMTAAFCILTGSVNAPSVLPAVYTVSAETVKAKSLAEIEEEKKQKQAEIDRKAAELAVLEQNITDQAAYVQALEDQIALIGSKMLLIDTELNRLRTALDENEQEIEALEAQTAELEGKVAKGLEEFKSRIRTLYVHGNDSLLSALVGATDFYDVLAKIDLLQRIGKHDDEMLKKLRSQLNELAEASQQLTDSRKALTIKQAENEAARSDFDSSRRELDAASEKADATARELAIRQGAAAEDLDAAQKDLSILEDEEEQLMLEAARKAAEDVRRKAEAARQSSLLASQTVPTTYTTAKPVETSAPQTVQVPAVTTAPVLITVPAVTSATTAAKSTTATVPTTVTSAVTTRQTTAKPTTTTTTTTTAKTTSKYTTTTTTTTSKTTTTTTVTTLSTTSTTTTAGTTQPPSSASVLAWPAPGFYRISSGFGMRWGRMHNGIDITGPGIHYQPAVAAEAGTVIKAKGGCVHDYGTACSCNSGYGNYVQIVHENGLTTLYAHLAEIDVSVGQEVSLGETVGLIGATGNVVSSGGGGYHLHFGVIQDGAFVDPTQFLP